MSGVVKYFRFPTHLLVQSRGHSKMANKSGDLMDFEDLHTKTIAAREHALAVTRDYISQPRISELFAVLMSL